MKHASISRSSTVFLQGVIILIGIGALALLLWEPHLEGVNAHAAFFEVYADPFLMLVYAGSIPFFIALYQAFNVLGLAGQNKMFSEPAVHALRTIKYCALVIIGCIVAVELFIMLNHGNDDAAGAFSLGMIMIFVSIVIATAAAVFERMLQSAVTMKSEVDLTV